jgi:SAM-dependent methyltransferase
VLASLRARFAELNFHGSATLDALGTPLLGEQFHLRKDLPLYLRRVSAPTPLNTLVKLFVLDQTVSADEAAAAFAPLDVSAVAATGLVVLETSGVRAQVRLSAFNGLLLTHDGYDDTRRTLAEDHVIDVNPTTITLATLTPRHHVRRALDVGTGCGALALLASTHSDHVIATDTNARALNFATFNAALNGITNVEYRLGSLFDPVEGEGFDLITCNPPYVISPESRYIFRDGGRRGDAFSEDVVRQSSRYLNEGGYASVLCNWIIRGDERWSAPLERWVAESNCDAWLLCTSTPDPLSYAAMWNRAADRSGYDEALDRWTNYAAELAIESIGVGAVVQRRRAAADRASRWIRADRLPTAPIGPNPAPIARFFDGFDALNALQDDEQMLQQRCRLSPDQRLEQTLAAANGQFVITHAQVCLDSGLRFRGTVDTYTTRLLSLCDGERTLGEIASRLTDPGGENATQVRRACAAIARQLVASGFLLMEKRST